LSLGLIGNLSTEQNAEGAVDLAVRPLGNEMLSLFGDYVFQQGLPKEAVNWSAGAAVEPIPELGLLEDTLKINPLILAFNLVLAVHLFHQRCNMIKMQIMQIIFTG